MMHSRLSVRMLLVPYAPVAHAMERLCQECPPATRLRALHVALRDSPRTEAHPRAQGCLGLGRQVLRHFPEVFRFLDAAEGAALVHCFEGKNRSATFVVAYLMQKERRESRAIGYRPYRL